MKLVKNVKMKVNEIWIYFHSGVETKLKGALV